LRVSHLPFIIAYRTQGLSHRLQPFIWHYSRFSKWKVWLGQCCILVWEWDWAGWIGERVLFYSGVKIIIHHGIGVKTLNLLNLPLSSLFLIWLIGNSQWPNIIILLFELGDDGLYFFGIPLLHYRLHKLLFIEV